MRGTVAKRLRRGAELATVGMPTVAYNYSTRQKYRIDALIGKIPYSVQHVTIKDECTRKAYTMYKRMWLDAQRLGHHA